MILEITSKTALCRINQSEYALVIAGHDAVVTAKASRAFGRHGRRGLRVTIETSAGVRTTKQEEAGGKLAWRTAQSAAGAAGITLRGTWQGFQRLMEEAVKRSGQI
jgi:hypothetical protein